MWVVCNRCGMGYSEEFRQPGERCGDLSYLRSGADGLPCLGICRASSAATAAFEFRLYTLNLGAILGLVRGGWPVQLAGKLVLIFNWTALELQRLKRAIERDERKAERLARMARGA